MEQLKEHSIEEAARERRIKSYVVYRDGRLLEEWHETGRDAIGPLYSCTKSVLSTLIGIAMHRGEIESLRQPISAYLGGVEIGGENGHPITIEHLLTMTPGFDWPVAYGAVKFTNSLPIRGIPTVIIFGRDGKAIWSGIGAYGLEAALDDALARDAAGRPQADEPPAVTSRSAETSGHRISYRTPRRTSG